MKVTPLPPASSGSREPDSTRGRRLIGRIRIDRIKINRVRINRSRVPARLRAPLVRLQVAIVPVLQCALGAGLAWLIATEIFEHKQPFFAPIAAVISLGLSVGRRWRRALEVAFGVTVGVAVGDLIISVIGSGTWQIMVVVVIAMSAAVLLDKGPLVPMQAASSAVLVATLLPPGGIEGFNRMIDAFTGGVVAIIVIALMPTHPVLRARRDAADVFSTIADVLGDVAGSLRRMDQDRVRAALDRARGTQSGIDALRADISGGEEISRISPLHWANHSRFDRVAAVADPLDNAVRNVRVLARRASAAVDNSENIQPEIIELIAQLGHAFYFLHDMMLADPGKLPDQAEGARVLRSIARRSGKGLVADSGLTETVILAQIRSTVVDLLMVCGLSRVSAVATLR